MIKTIYSGTETWYQNQTSLTISFFLLANGLGYGLGWVTAVRKSPFTIPLHRPFHIPIPVSMDDGFITATDGYYRGTERERKTDRLVKTKVSSCLGFN